MKTQALGWLAAGVLAAGLNASYHDGGLAWAHRVADRIEDRSAAVLALATGRADEFVARMRMASARNETASCRLTSTIARVQSRMERSETGFAEFEAMSDRQQARMDRMEANRVRIEARLARIRIPAVSFNPAVFPAAFRAVSVSEISVPQIDLKDMKIPVVCPRVRVRVPQPPMVKVPMVHIDVAGSGPV
jgi:hypothetical protein